MTSLDVALEVLKKSAKPLTLDEIYDQARLVSSHKKHSIGAALYVDIKENINSKFYKTEKPTKFGFKNNVKLNNEDNNNVVNINILHNNKKPIFHERDLHPILVKFLKEYENFRLFSKTIFHEKSSKNTQGKNIWNYPDIVGVKFPFDMEKQTLNLLTNINQSQYKLYSFELKKSINFSNLKESYFQAVSNSSWSNEGYLVVFESINKEIKDELKRLNASFGIGVIQLNKDISKCEIILSSFQKNLDIQTINMLIKESPDFNKFIKT